MQSNFSVYNGVTDFIQIAQKTPFHSVRAFLPFLARPKHIRHSRVHCGDRACTATPSRRNTGLYVPSHRISVLYRGNLVIGDGILLTRRMKTKLFRMVDEQRCYGVRDIHKGLPAGWGNEIDDKNHHNH
jgi:hypothetical protein